MKVGRTPFRGYKKILNKKNIYTPTPQVAQHTSKPRARRSGSVLNVTPQLPLSLAQLISLPKSQDFQSPLISASQGVDIVIEMTDDSWQQMNAQADAQFAGSFSSDQPVYV